MGTCGTEERPWSTSRLQTVATCLARCTSCSTNADCARVMPPQSPMASSMATLASPVPSKSERRAIRRVPSFDSCCCSFRGRGGARTRKPPVVSVGPALMWVLPSRRSPACSHVWMVSSAMCSGHPLSMSALRSPVLVAVCSCVRRYRWQAFHLPVALQEPNPQGSLVLSEH